MNFKNILVVFIVLCSVSFFGLIIVPKSIMPIVEFIGIGLILMFLLLNFVYDKTVKLKSYFSLEVSLILGGVLLSMFGAYLFHGQSFSITAVAQRHMYFFIFYFLLIQLKPHPRHILQIIFYLGVTVALIYIIQYSIYPVNILQSKIFIDRGTIRIFIPGFIFVYLTFFLSLSLFFINKNYKYLAVVLLALCVFILMATRQVLFVAIFLALMYVLLSKQVKSKLAIYFFIVLALIPLYFIFQEIFLSMFEITNKQSSNTQEDVRYRAITFFLTDFFPNKVAYFTGNGAESSNSGFGIKVNNYKKFFGFFQSDIGLIGDYTKFGALLVIGQFMAMYRIIRFKLPPQLVFIKIFVWSVALTLITGGSFAQQGSTTAICLLLYLIDAYLANTGKEEPNANAPANPVRT